MRGDVKTPRSRVWLKVFLSIFIFYHLATVIILPNGSSIFVRQFSRYLLPYANPFIFNRPWQFFLPGPMPSFYLEYNLLTDAGPAVDDQRPALTYPPPRKARIDDFYLRTNAGMRLLATQPDLFESDFIAFLCRLHPDAVALDLRSVFEQIPPIEKAGLSRSFEDMSERTTLPRKTYQCPGRSYSTPAGDSSGDES